MAAETCTGPPQTKLVIPTPSRLGGSLASPGKPERAVVPRRGCALTIDEALIDDDYCDCEDGTDEPHTSACVRGSFSCGIECNAERFIPSGW